MRKAVFALSGAGLIAASILARLSSVSMPALPPAFTPAANPYPNGIYANGILESVQPAGQNTNVFPEVPGTVTQILVAEGQEVPKGTELLRIDDSVQRATVSQLKAAAESALSQLEQLRAQPRPESLAVAEAQVVAGRASVKTAEDAVEKQQTAFALNPKSVSKDSLDTALNAVALAEANLQVTMRQRDLIKAGAWIYDIRTQQRQYEALRDSYQSASALLFKYTLRAPRNGRVLAINTSIGGYVSAQGAYDSYTQGQTPVLVLGSEETLQVRCFVDEILLPRLPRTMSMKAQMAIRGSDVRIPLRFVRTQPIVSPKIELSNQRLESVDVRVLPIIFALTVPEHVTLYAGQLVDVYIGER